MQQASPGDHPASGMTLRQTFELHYQPDLVEEGRTGTIASYETAISRWERHSENPKNPPVCQIDSPSLERFRKAVLAAGLRPATFNSTWRHLRALLRRLGPQHDRNPRGLSILDRIPYVKLAIEDLDFPRIATFEELDALYAACEHACWPTTILPPREFWHCHRDRLQRRRPPPRYLQPADRGCRLRETNDPLSCSQDSPAAVHSAQRYDHRTPEGGLVRSGDFLPGRSQRRQGFDVQQIPNRMAKALATRWN